MQVRFVTLDATGTLFHCPRLGEIYSSVLARHGIEVSAERATQLVQQVWAEFDCSGQMNRDRFATHPEGPRGWWRRFLNRFCEHLGGPRASRFASSELYDRFARTDSWQLFPDVVPCLDELSAAGLGVAVVSNWDPRLAKVIEGLGLVDRLADIFCSSEVGFEKPHPGIFESALAGLGAEPGEVLHVGDSRRLDVEGAQAVGMRAAHLDRSGRGELTSLTEVPGLIERLCYLEGNVSR